VTRTATVKLSESQIQRAILDYLAARHVLAFRMNTGTMTSEYKGKKRLMRFGVPGMADILAFPPHQVASDRFCAVMWIEVKSEIGRQSETQQSFQEQVEREGHKYIVARSVEDVIEALQ